MKFADMGAVSYEYDGKGWYTGVCNAVGKAVWERIKGFGLIVFGCLEWVPVIPIAIVGGFIGAFVGVNAVALTAVNLAGGGMSNIKSGWNYIF